MTPEHPDYSGHQVPSVFELDDETQQRMKAAYDRGVRGISNVLFLVAAMFALFELLAGMRIWTRGFNQYAILAAALDLIVVGIYVGLGLWAKRKPFYALLVGIGIDLVIQLAYWVTAGSFKGAALLTFVLFLSSIRKAKALQKYPGHASVSETSEF